MKKIKLLSLLMLYQATSLSSTSETQKDYKKYKELKTIKENLKSANNWVGYSLLALAAFNIGAGISWFISAQGDNVISAQCDKSSIKKSRIGSCLFSFTLGGILLYIYYKHEKSQKQIKDYLDELTAEKFNIYA